MTIGMNRLRSTDVSGRRYDPVFERTGELGFDGVEIPIWRRLFESAEQLVRDGHAFLRSRL